jgi:hypothetical protein
MPTVPEQLVRDLHDRLGLERAVETGTYRGEGARVLADVFERVATIEIAPGLARAAANSLSSLRNVEVICGDSCEVLPTLVDPARPTLYWLDGHWSGGETGGHRHECPVLAELGAVSGGHPDDCILIDDARLFLAPPPPPHNAEDWPRYRDIEDALRLARPSHLIIVAHDVVVSVPQGAADIAEDFTVAGRSHTFEVARRAARRILR